MRSQPLTMLLVAALALACDRGPVGPDRGGAQPSDDHVEWIQVDSDASGKIAKCTVYHSAAEQIPKSVRDLAARKFPGASGRFFETELYPDLGLVYEVEVRTADGRNCEVAGRPDGTELYTECEIAKSRVPEAVDEAWRAQVSGGELHEAEEKRGPTIDEIDVEVLRGDEVHYLRYTREGQLIQHLVRMRGSVGGAPS